jgi:hypothetical protein
VGVTVKECTVLFRECGVGRGTDHVTEATNATYGTSPHPAECRTLDAQVHWNFSPTLYNIAGPRNLCQRQLNKHWVQPRKLTTHSLDCWVTIKISSNLNQTADHRSPICLSLLTLNMQNLRRGHVYKTWQFFYLSTFRPYSINAPESITETL